MSSASTTFASGQSPTATQVNGWAQGTLGYAQVTANQTGITTETSLTGLTLTLTLVAGRRIRIGGSVSAQSSIANDEIILRIKEGATQLTAVGTTVPVASRDDNLSREIVISPSAGSHTYNLTLQRNGGTGTVQMSSSSTFPAFILVEDIGAV